MKEQSIQRFSEHLFFFSAIAFSVGLSTSKIILSVSSMLMVLSILLQGNYKSIPGKIKSAVALHPLLFFLGIHIIGLIWTADFTFAGNDLKTKLTLLIVPVAFALQPLSLKKINGILHFFIAAVFLTSLINILAWHQVFGTRIYTDIRELSLFGSHIRYGILVAMAATVCIYQIKQSSGLWKFLFVIVAVWFAYYTYFSQIVSGLLAFLTMLFSFCFWYIYQKNKVLAAGLSTVLVLFILTAVYVLLKPSDTKTSFAQQDFPSLTLNGNPYTHNLEPGTFFNGKPVLANLCEEELRDEWNRVSNIDYDGKDLKGQALRFTLMRYLTLMDLRKDSLGVHKLSKEDITFIEKGIASREEANGGLLARWHGIRFQLQNSGDPNGHSLLQRLEYWKTAAHIIKKNWLLGVGTGDLQKSFDEQYTIDKSRLLPEYRLRAHNSYLTAWVSFGIAGILLFLWMILRFINQSIQTKHFLGFTFILIASATFILEDTLETQMGASFFAFFFGVFLSQGAKAS